MVLYYNVSLYNNNNQSRSMEPMGLNYGNAKGLPVLKTLEKGKFEVKERLLGKGSFAKTFLAVNTESKELLACKMINKQDLVNLINEYQAKHSAKNYFVKALKNEMITSKKVKHQNIVSCEEVLETSSNIYFFLELCNHGCAASNSARSSSACRRASCRTRRPCRRSARSWRGARTCTTRTSSTAT